MGFPLGTRRGALVSLILCLLSLPAGGADPPPGVEFQRDVVYGKGGDVDLKLNLARPGNANGAGKKLPCVVVIHGGGWMGGDRTHHDDLTWKFAERGFVAATVGYRLAPAHRFPAQVHDVKCAVRFLRANADKYNFDPGRVGAIGFSAGGHLSMMLGVTDKADGLEGEGGSPDQSSKVQAVVSFFGPTDLLAPDIPERVNGILHEFIGGTKDAKRAEYTRASPITYVTPGDAPMLLLQGTKDPLVPHTQTYPMLEAMTRHNVPGRVELLVGAGHGWGGPEMPRTATASYAFFDEHLKPRERAAAGAGKGAEKSPEKSPRKATEKPAEYAPAGAAGRG